jgi:hypothetical protein
MSNGNGGGGDYQLDKKQAKKKKDTSSNSKPYGPGPDGSQGIKDPKYAKYLNKYSDLRADYEKNWKGKGVTEAEYGAMHYHEYGKSEGRSLSGAKNFTSTSTSTSTRTRTSTGTGTKPTDPKYKKTSTAPKYKKTSTAPTYEKTTNINLPSEPTEKAIYDGPEYNPDKSIIPTNIELLPVSDDEFVENRIASILDKNSPLFRQAAESRVRAMAGRGLGRNSSMAQEEVMRALFSVAGPIAEADARMLERHRTLQNTAYYEDMNTRLQGVIQETLSHIAGGYQIQAANIADITNRWKTKVAAELQRYGIDTDAELKAYGIDTQIYGIDTDAEIKKYGIDTQIYGIDVGAEIKKYGIDVQKYGMDVRAQTSKYLADLQFELGKMGIDVQLQGLKVDAANILKSISDNAEASAYIWDLIFGSNVSPGEWIDKWKNNWGQQ